MANNKGYFEDAKDRAQNIGKKMYAKTGDTFGFTSPSERAVRDVGNFFQRQKKAVWSSLSKKNQKELEEWGKAFNDALDDIGSGMLKAIEKIESLGAQAANNVDNFMRSLGGLCEAVVGVVKTFGSKDQTKKNEAQKKLDAAKKAVSFAAQGKNRETGRKI